MPRRRARLAAGAVLAALTTFTAPLPAQHSAGAELWRLAAATIPVPSALAAGGAAAFWNPAQRADSAQVLLGVEAIQTPSAIGATGFLTALHVRAGRAGRFGLVYGRMQLDGLVRTYTSPDPEQAGTIPFFTHAIGGTWAGSVAGTAVGATIAYRETRLDRSDVGRWTLDAGVSRPINHVLRLAVATHAFSRVSASDDAQDVFAGVEYRFFSGTLWEGGPPATLRARYGVSVAHGFGADHQIGAGMDFSNALAFDVLVVRTGGYAQDTWRAVAGLGVGVGRYRLSFARDGGTNGVGSAFRVALETRLR
jgi:hypothetical protein